MSLPPVHVVQRDFPVGDIDGNCQTLLAAAARAQQNGAVAVLSPELSLSGYCPEDMLYDHSFMDAVERALQKIIAEAPPLPLIVGLPWRENGQLYNAAALISGGRLAGVYKKVSLPNHSVFDERRYFTGGDNPPLLFAAGGTAFAVQICADMWEPQQAARAGRVIGKADYILQANASPFYVGKHAERLAVAADFVRQAQAGLFFCNVVGGQDELIFDGASFVMDKHGKVHGQFPALTDYEGAADEITAAYPDDNEAVYNALTKGVRDYAAKTGFGGVLLGLSGGVDSALAASIAADALGGGKVLAVMMPSRYTAALSVEDATAIAGNLGAELLTIPLDPLMDAVGGALQPHLQNRANDVTLENVQARLRGQLLMALSNNRGLLLLATGNKSELACGYATLYGDMCGGFAPLKDLSKTRVWELAAYRNRKSPVIPPRVISRAPSAELRDNQTDQQTLPPYQDIDAAIDAYIERRVSRAQVLQKLGGDFAGNFFNRLAAGEHKRRQGAIGPKVTRCAFGRDWRMPVANGYRYNPHD